MNYDVAIIGAGPGGIYSAYELVKLRPDLKICLYDSGNSLNLRKCPIDGKKIKSCISCKSCSIMTGFGGAGAFSDGKYNITNYIKAKEKLEEYKERYKIVQFHPSYNYDDFVRGIKMEIITEKGENSQTTIPKY